MDFVRSHFGKKQLWQVEHFFLHKKVPVYYYTVIVFNFLELHFSEVTSYQIHTLAPHVFSSNWRGINDFFFCECVYVVRRTWSFSPKGHDHIYIFVYISSWNWKWYYKRLSVFRQKVTKIEIIIHLHYHQTVQFPHVLWCLFFYLIDKKN